ncbi:nitrate/nitrite transporter NrtS [Pseudonocardia nigra]|uniref:nitrate/nitrite transporter NrtS n=1 Tax=Pseudonocardia nigra TaxID=1921578 RepID=UPI001C5D1D71|nr:nitrate/nitrite transporter NrtS [Pseudonocardia nigra]
MSAGHREIRPVIWSRPGEAVLLFLCGRTARTAAPVAAVVGTLLSVVNQGHLVLDGGDAATWIRVGVNYLVPYCVASIGFLSARRMRPGAEGVTPDPSR